MRETNSHRSNLLSHLIDLVKQVSKLESEVSLNATRFAQVMMVINQNSASLIEKIQEQDKRISELEALIVSKGSNNLTH